MLVRNYKDVPAVDYAEGVEKRVLLGPNQGAPTFVMRVFDLAPGVSSKHHAHLWEHEVFILAGHGVVVTDDGEIPLKPQDAVLLRSREMHHFANRGQDTFRFICVIPVRGEDTP